MESPDQLTDKIQLKWVYVWDSFLTLTSSNKSSTGVLREYLLTPSLYPFLSFGYFPHNNTCHGDTQRLRVGTTP